MRHLLVVLLLAIPLSACGSTLGRQQLAPTAPKSITLENGDTIGQTFAAQFDGLAGIELYIQPRTAGDGELRLHLRAGPHAPDDLAAGALPVAQIARPGFYRLTFQPQPASRGRDYYALIEFAGHGRVKVDRADGDAYLDGVLYQDGKPEDAQLTSTLIYDQPEMLRGFANLGLVWLGMLLAGVLLYVVPGWALLEATWPAARALPWAARLGLAAGLSLALYPLLLLWTNLVGLHAGPLYAWTPVIVGLATLLWRSRARLLARRANGVVGVVPPGFGLRRRRGEEARVLAPSSVSHDTAVPVVQPEPGAAWRVWARSDAFWPDLALVVTIVLIAITRFSAAGDIDVPVWGDSYHHTLITQLLVDNGGLFNSWQPYAEMQSLTYHFGFHTAAAVMHWVSGLAVPQAVVWAGQLLNVLAVLALYPLALRVGGSRWAGVGAVLLAGLLAPMPSYYINWGRYTQLAGQAILPAAIFLIWAAIEGERPTSDGRRPTSSGIGGAVRSRFAAFRSFASWRFFILPWVALAGLGLAHYRVLIFVVFFFPALFLFQLGRQPLASLVGRMAAVGVGAGLLFIPWFVHVFAGRILANLAIRLSTPAAALPAATQEYNAPVDPRTILPALVWLLLLFALAWALWRRERAAALIGLWWLFLLLAVNPHWIGLPGTGALTNFALLIAAYIPAGVLLGAGLSWLLSAADDRPFASTQGRRSATDDISENRESRTENRISSFATLSPCHLVTLSAVIRGMMAVLLAGLALWGAGQRLADLDVAQHALVTRPDERAAAWIKANTPPDARFLVNAFFAYGGATVVGSDGGWWLPLLAGRQTTLPPILYGSEQAPRPDYRLWINALPTLLGQKPPDDPEVLAMLRERGVTHVYIGQRQGRLNYDGPGILEPRQLLASPHFRPVYHEDRVWVFEVVR
jgi:hypothetical protein